MKNTRLVHKDEANVVSKPGVVIFEYFKQIAPTLGLATATMNGTYPPENEGVWSINEQLDEMYYVLQGEATIVHEDGCTITLGPRVCTTIPLGTHFQFRSIGDEPLEAIGVTMPYWPGKGEAIIVTGKWESTFPER